MTLCAVVVLAHVLQKMAEVDVRPHVRVIERDAPRVRRVRGLAGLHPVLIVVRTPEREPRLTMVRVQRDAVLERCDGLGPFFLLQERHTLRVLRCR